MLGVEREAGRAARQECGPLKGMVTTLHCVSVLVVMNVLIVEMAMKGVVMQVCLCVCVGTNS